VELISGNDAPAVWGGKEVVEEFQGDVAKLEVRPIWVEKGRRIEFSEDRGSPAKRVTAARLFR
jgi:hypothetical protein